MDLEKILTRMQITALNKMQEFVYESAALKKDILLLSPTGSGKTVAFLLPILDHLNAGLKEIQVVILVPSRELALQIEQVFKQMTNEFKIVCCYGGHSTKIEKNSLIQAPAVLVGTPGRIAHHVDHGNFNPFAVSALVLDEFDKSLEFGFQNDMSYIIKSLKSLKQRFLTSATDLDELPNFIQTNNFIKVDFLKDHESKPAINFKKVLVTLDNRDEQLLKLVTKSGNQSAIIFANFRETTDDIAGFLTANGIGAEIYHGGLAQDQRERALLKFRNGSTNVLVTTDLGARGLDIPEVQNIIHYQLPNTEDAFIHRNGRTARMNSTGDVYLLLKDSDDFKYLPADIEEEKLAGKYEKPQKTAWQTLYLSVGKKDKVNKVDVVGFLLKIGGLQKDEVGLIEVKDQAIFVAIKSILVDHLVKKLQNQKIKGKKVKIEIAS